ncbi:MAG: signal peptidase II [Anaerolineae bacterium]
MRNVLEKEQRTSLPGRSLIFLVVVGVVVLALDQLTKVWVLTSLPEGGWWSPLPGLWRVIRITHITNSGAAFGIFPNQGNFFIIVAVVVALAIVLYYRYLPTGNWLVRLSLGLQLGGAIGNLLDRIRYGHVVDFVDIGFWPIFNVADLAIVTGVGILAYCLWHEEQVAHSLTFLSTDDEGKS